VGLTSPKTLAEQAKLASRQLVTMSTEHKNRALIAMADSIHSNSSQIMHANAIDIENGKRDGLSTAMLDRLMLNDSRIAEMAKGMRDVALLPDPVGRVLNQRELASGLLLKKITTPIGVMAIIFESRPNVTCEAVALCMKSSNAVILRGGKEAIHSNRAIVSVLNDAWTGPDNAFQLVTTTDRDAIRELVQLEGLIDVVIPRGGENLIKAVTEWSRIPIIKHDKGVCHVYVDEFADLDMAFKIVENAKCQRPSACNALETVLIHEKVAHEFLPMLQKLDVELRDQPGDWGIEYLDRILAVRVVANVDEAIEHVAKYGSGHSDAIVTRHIGNQEQFVSQVDSAAVYVNASTRFTDGGQFGMGAEMGISTGKLHVRGPMGLEEMTTYKWVGVGTGQVRL
jgi:glutamate-5-semialdehyde dehydrogenase